MPVYSHSRLSRFEDCPRAYKFRYIQKAKVKRVRNAYAFLGNQVHQTLEVLHEDLKNGKRNSLDSILDIFSEFWDKDWAEDIQVPDRYSPEHFRSVGERCIINYYENHEPFNRDRTIDTELILRSRVSTEGQEYTFKGYVDRLALTPDGRYEIHDYKTSKNLPTQNELENDRQLALYQLGVQQKYPDANDVELVWHYVRFGKDIRFSRLDKDIDRIQKDLVNVIRRIERARGEDDFPTMRGKGATCKWCDYKHICPEWSHFYQTKKLPKNEFLGEEGVKLVDELTGVEAQLGNLDDERSELEKKRKKLEEAILKYASRKGVNAVFGNEKKAMIEVKERIKFPRSKDPRREELDRLIRESGLWDDLSVNYLNLRSLSRAFKRGDLPEELLGELEDFKEVEESRDVKLGDLED